MDELKIELLQKIINCNDEKLLKEVDNILKSFPSEVKEDPQSYSKEADVSILTENQKKTKKKWYENKSAGLGEKFLQDLELQIN